MKLKVSVHWRAPGKDARHFRDIDVLQIRNDVLLLKKGADGWRFPMDLIEEIRTWDVD